MGPSLSKFRLYITLLVTDGVFCSPCALLVNRTRKRGLLDA